MDNIQKTYLAETARWQKVLGIILAICTGLMALFGIILFFVGNKIPDNELLGDFYGPGMGTFYLLFAVLYFFYTRFLLRSAKYLKAYVANEEEADLTEGLKNNKSFFKFSGILTLVCLGFVVLALIGVVIAGVALS